MKIEIKEPLAPRILSLMSNLFLVGLLKYLLLDCNWGRSIHGVPSWVAWVGEGFGWINLAIFAFAVFRDIQRLWDTRPRLLMDDAGISVRALKRGPIPWSEIHDAFMRSDYADRRIYLDVAKTGSNPRSRLETAGFLLGRPSFCIDLGGTEFLPKIVLMIIRGRIAKKEPVS